VEVRGEVFIPTAEFTRLNDLQAELQDRAVAAARERWQKRPATSRGNFDAEREAASAARRFPAFANPRNAASGGLRQLLEKKEGDRKSTRLNSSHVSISYAVLCLKKRKQRSDYIT